MEMNEKLNQYLFGTKIYSIYTGELDRLEKACAGEKHHHNFSGGLIRHIVEMIEFALPIQESLKTQSGEDLIDKKELIVSIFLHDLAKIDFYAQDENSITYSYVKHSLVVQEMVVQNYCSKYGIELTENELNALWMAEGGWAHLAETLENSPLATLVHMADLYSAILIKPQLRSDTICPQCGKGELVKRTNGGTGNIFWACNKYPECKYTQAGLPKMELVENLICKEK